MPNKVLQILDSSPIHNTLYIRRTALSTHYVECEVSKENLGDHRVYYAKDHLIQHPNNLRYPISATITVKEQKILLSLFVSILSSFSQQ